MAEHKPQEADAKIKELEQKVKELEGVVRYWKWRALEAGAPEFENFEVRT